ncbi:unnamed protein product, partial [Nesidiocoris tenuis]
DEVLHALKALNPDKGMGPDGVPPCLLRSCADVLAIPLAAIFNKSLNAGSFPVKWKDSYVTPIFKSGCKTLVSNYRAVCTISSIPKSFEKLVVGRLSPIFVNVIAPEQHGFIKGRSTTTNLVEFTDFVFSGFDSGEQVDVVSVDFAKAFDRVSHKHITALLQSMGVYGPILSWIESYLSDRRQFVRFKNVVSEPYRASSGIPQGSNIGPLLFVIMINSVTSIPRPEGVELLMFADDLKILGVVSSEDDYMGIQTFLDSLQGWCLANCLHLNPAKCTAASFSRSSRLLSFPYRIGGGVLDRPASIRDLGVFMDAKLTFSHHIDAIVSKALRALGFLKRCTRDFTSMEAIVLLYKSLVRPILEYSSVVWSPYYQVHKERLERVQRRFLRYLNFKMHIPLEELDIVELAARSGLQDLEVRRTMADLMFLFKLLNAEISSPALLARISFNAPGTQNAPVAGEFPVAGIVVRRRRFRFLFGPAPAHERDRAQFPVEIRNPPGGFAACFGFGLKRRFFTCRKISKNRK